jgi:hypothetical protein
MYFIMAPHATELFEIADLSAVYDGDMEINPLMEYPIPFFA